MSLDATPSGASANSYVTVAQADTYFATRLNATAWTDSSEQEAALIQATRWLDHFDYRGERAVPQQPLRWPREFVYDEDGYELATATIPREVRDATCEAALALLSSGDVFARSELGQFSRAKVGPLEVEVRQAYIQSDLPDVVQNILGRWLLSSGISGRLWRS